MKIQDLKSIRKKIFQYCAYQERSTFQVLQKLKEYSLEIHEIEDIIAELKANRFLDDERYIKSFVRGKFRNCHWGKLKIEQELLMQNFDKESIQMALNEIEEDEYLETLENIAIKKLKSFSKDAYRVQKTTKFLLQKGYEIELVQKIIKNIIKDGKLAMD